jgi:hypothetical protein
MEMFMGEAMMIEAALLSFLLALWISWLGMCGLFRLMPARTSSIAPVGFVSNRRQEDGSRKVA